MSTHLIRKTYQGHGLSSAMHLITFKSLNKMFFIKKLCVVVIDEVKQESLKVDAKFDHGFIDETYLKKLSMEKENELPEKFLTKALLNRDDCYAVSHNGELAGFGWYSNRETMTDILNLEFCFKPEFMYMYKGLTKKDYRGQRLHAVGMSWALKHYLEKGFKGIVSYVESTNFDSLKSCFRMGYKEQGSIWVIKIFGRVIHYTSPSLSALGVYLK